MVAKDYLFVDISPHAKSISSILNGHNIRVEKNAQRDAIMTDRRSKKRGESMRSTPSIMTVYYYKESLEYPYSSAWFLIGSQSWH